MPIKKAKTPTKKEVEEVIEPQVAQDNQDTSVEEEFETSFSEAFEGDVNFLRYSIKLDNKKIEGRSLTQIQLLLDGVAGAVKKIVIEQE